jgi:DNA repair exonuclease SbcCD ATPase subunit
MSDSTQNTSPLGQTGNSGESGGVAHDQRINDLMGKWQSEQAVNNRLQAEITRLQGLLATAVTTEAELRQQITTAATQTTEQTQAAEQRATAAESLVAELRQTVTTLEAKVQKADFLLANGDLIAYASVLPQTGDVATLQAAAETIRAANAQTQTAMRNQLTQPSRGGQTPRGPAAAPMAPADIEAYLRNGPASEFEQRLATVQARLSQK